MDVIFAKASFNGDATLWSGQEGITKAEIIQIGRWHICAAINKRECVVEYNQPDLLERLRSYGYQVSEETRIFEIDGDSFNSMEFTRYEHETGALFLFHGLAVNVDYWTGIKTLCKRDLSLDGAIGEWDLEDTVEADSLSIPNDSIGELALKINDLQFEIWSDHWQAPGQSDDLEERLESLSVDAERMKQGISPKDSLEDMKESLSDFLVDYRERLDAATSDDDHKYYRAQIASVEAFTARADNLICESEKVLSQRTSQ